METQTTEDLNQYITDDLVIDVCRRSLKGECSWEAVDPMHQTIMGTKARSFLERAVYALRDAGWIPPGKAYPDHLPIRSHPRGRLREVIKDHLTPRFENVSRSKVYSTSDVVYRWHLGEMRYIRLVSLAREINDLADQVEEWCDTEDREIQWVVSLLRGKADEFEDEIEDPR